MSKTMQKLVVVIEPSENAFDICWKGGKMCLNLFCIDEDAAFELSGVDYFKKSFSKNSLQYQLKGKGYTSYGRTYAFLQLNFTLKSVINSCVSFCLLKG